MMIMGDGVGGKYRVIIEGRRKELLEGVTDPAVRAERIDSLDQFRHEVQHGKRPEFDELYELYK